MRPTKTDSIAISLVALLVYLAYVIILIQVPAYARDELTHHLALPKLWSRDGLLHEYPDILFSYYPQLLDLLYYIPVKVGQDTAARYIHLSFALLTALLVFTHVRKRLGISWACLSALFTLGTPLILRLSTTAYVDLGLMFFTSLSLVLLCQWLDSGRTRTLALSAVAMGLALSCKYSALTSFLTTLLVTTLVFVRYSDKSMAEWRRLLYCGLLFTGISVLVFSPWLLRNLILTDNPVYPLHPAAFVDNSLSQNDSLKRIITEELQSVAEKPGVFRYRHLVYSETLSDIATIPVRIFFQGEDDNPQYFDGVLHPALLLLPLLLMLFHRRLPVSLRRDTLFLGSYSLVLTVMTTLTVDMRARYVICIIPPLSILCVYSLFCLSEYCRERRPGQTSAAMLTGIIVIATAAYSGLYAARLYEKIEPIPYLAGSVSRDEYLQSRNPEHSAVMAANGQMSDGDRLLGVFMGERYYYFDAPVILNNMVWFHLSAQSHSAADMYHRLTRLGITHTLFNTLLLNNWLSLQPAETTHVIQEFLNSYCHVAASTGSYLLCTINRH